MKMRSHHRNNELQGVAFVAVAYVLWGVLPIYWKLLGHVDALEVLCHRAVWSFVFMQLLVIISGQWNSFRTELAQILVQPRKLGGIVLAAAVLNLNWFLYIWAVIHDHVIQASLGYYINPLISVLLGMIVLKEKLNFWQGLAFLLALLGVLNLVFHFGSIPWIALLLALSFGVYGLLKKMVGARVMTGLTLETMIMTIPASFYLVYNHQTSAFGTGSPVTTVVLMGAGVITAIPLLLFSSGALRLSLTVIGFLQYINPTLTLLLGIFLYHESFTYVHLISFILIWAGLIVFTVSGTRHYGARKREQVSN